MRANTLPLLTWRWLKVNESLIELPEVVNQEHEVVAKEGDEISALFDIKSVDYLEKGNSRHTKINIKAKKNSVVNIYYVSRCKKEISGLTDIQADIEEGATVNLIQIEAGGKEVVTNYIANLSGKGASTNVEACYFVSGDDKLDIFYDVRHIAEETNSNIMVNGALKDRAKKSFKGTIDFKRGSKGSKGAEEEYATLLDDGVRNIAVPVLLAQEDDVEGLHAASAGKIDQDVLFYIMSRGLDIEEAKKMIVQTKLLPTIDKLPDSEIASKVWESIDSRI